MVRVFLIDDDFLQLDGLPSLLASEGGMTVVGIVLASPKDAEQARRALSEGALAQRAKAIDPSIREAISRRVSLAGDEGRMLQSLSERERDVLRLTVHGRTIAQTARELGLSPKSVETYRSRMMTKLGIDDLPALVKFAIRQGITSL